MKFNALFYLAVLLFAGLLFSKLAKLIKTPNVTGYLVAGLLLGPSVLGIVSEESLTSFDLISEIALGFIAFSIGSVFSVSYFKRVGFAPVVIAVTEGTGAVIVVITVLIIAGFEIPLSIILGSIAAATAPAATIMVIRQYKAKGPLTEMLLSVVALDDAVALICFGLAVTIAKSITDNSSGMLIVSLLLSMRDIFGALLIGAALGALFMLPLKYFRDESNRLCLIVAFVFIAIALADYLKLSELLTCMAMGGVFVNLYKSSDDIMKITDFATPPIFLLFFAVSGAELKLSILPTIGIIGIIYLLFRVLGKMAGAWFGAYIMKSPAVIKKYLGPTLIPQAGVAIGLSLLAKEIVPQYESVIRAVVLCATLIYELFGPIISKVTLQRAGEIKEEENETEKDLCTTEVKVSA